MEDTSTEQIRVRLRELILQGGFLPGQKLHQDRIAEMLGVSRTPLRSALSALAETGLVEYNSNRGYTVRRFTLQEARDGFRMRAELEAMACRLSAPLMAAADIERLHELTGIGDALLSGQELKADALQDYRAMNVEFHTIVLRAARNHWIETFVNQLFSLPLISDRIMIWEDFGAIKRSHDDHHRIAAALARRDGERAGAVMFEHVLFAGDFLFAHLQNQPGSLLESLTEADGATPLAAARQTEKPIC